MSNLLAIPFKKTYPIDVKEAARGYIYAQGGGHPDEYKEDINLWQNLRKTGVGGAVHLDRINPALLYHAQLVSILTKVSHSIDLEIPYAPVFLENVVPITLKNLVFERCSVIFNLAALYSQLAASEDRSSMDGIKRATANYQYAAGTLSFLRASAIPKLFFSSEDERPHDLTDVFATAIELLMLAQAQECSWQMAKLNQYKNGLIAKVAARVASLYQSASQTIRNASAEIRGLLPSDWLPHIEAKSHHFFAVSEYRKSMDEIEGSRYGVEIARLHEAQTEAKKAFDIARRGRVATLVVQDIQSLLETVQKNLSRAERDNDLIYHHDVPASSALTQIAQVNLVSSTVPVGLNDPTSVIGNGKVIFGELVGWGTREAINIYNDRKRNLVKEKIVDASIVLRDSADDTLRRLNLPSALEALERPIGLPPSLLRKAEEVRLENGPAKIEVSIEDVQRLAQQDQTILDEAMDILDNEASEDEAVRKRTQLSRPPSHEANMDLIEKEKRYRSILAQAAVSDETVRTKWDEWERNIVELTWNEEDLEASIPSSTTPSSIATTTQGKQTQTHARALRVQLEALEDLHRTREQLVRRARTLETADDIRERVMKVAEGFARLVEVEPAMFEDVLDEELAKYDRFLTEMIEIQQRQSSILAEVQRRNDLFLQSRKDDPAVKERESALQALDLAYHKYREITRNLDEGFKFYNDLATILLQFKEACKNWSRLRNQQIHSLTSSIQSTSVDPDDARDPTLSRNERTASSTPEPSNQHTQPTLQSPLPTIAQTSSNPTRLNPTRSSKPSSGLPPLTSDEWEFEDFQLPAPPR